MAAAAGPAAVAKRKKGSSAGSGKKEDTRLLHDRGGLAEASEDDSGEDQDHLEFPKHAKRFRSGSSFCGSKDWRGVALDLQEKVVLLQSILDRMAPLLVGLHNIDLNRDRTESSLSLPARCQTRSASADKNAMVDHLLELLHSSGVQELQEVKPDGASDLPDPMDHYDYECKLRAFEEVLWLLPTYWNVPNLMELSIIHLEASARDIAEDLLQEKDDVSSTEAKTARIVSLILHLAGLVCSHDPFENEMDDVQQIHAVKESCVNILRALGTHPIINLQIIQCFVKQLLARATAALDSQTASHHVFVEGFYWILHTLEMTLEKEMCLDDPLTISKWSTVQDVTQNILQLEIALLDDNNALSRNILFMGKWKEILKRFSVYFLVKCNHHP
ncbi:hypothetical protein HOP50_07g49540 [Chloropicon primus]|uniref:Uncharacterized protein n=1 Tax=Chloropicon primus TaxID=1764295 RepID=A0A5B8MQX6_9CHLO|nr:hypothetical protein A3770_07p49320 [Chloropicon primus]UPR01632.1 hypothetical protein HOP50_07g49540 [Chloropicon primus]|eukprot:QDZ22414.1 hypothetical protein A3770_07p49320 [Chloropicon primus]